MKYYSRRPEGSNDSMLSTNGSAIVYCTTTFCSRHQDDQNINITCIQPTNQV